MGAGLGGEAARSVRFQGPLQVGDRRGHAELFVEHRLVELGVARSRSTTVQRALDASQRSIGYRAVPRRPYQGVPDCMDHDREGPPWSAVPRGVAGAAGRRVVPASGWP
jgi:hypothetical protein